MSRDELKPGRYYTDRELEEYVAAQSNGISWPISREKILRWAAEQLQGAYFLEADFAYLCGCLDARSERHWAANERNKAQTGRVDQDRTLPNGYVRATRQVGGLVQGVIGDLQTPVEASVDAASVRVPQRRVRGPARFDADRRYERRLKSREQAGKAKLPASIKRYFTMSQLSAFSVIVHRASKHAGICVLAVGSIAGISAVSARTVQDAVAIGKHANLITVHEQEGAPNIIRIVDPRILERLPDLGNIPYPSQPKSKISSTKTTVKSTRLDANFCLKDGVESAETEPLAPLDDRHTPKVARALPEPEPVPLAPVQDEAEEVRQEAVQEAAVEMEAVEVRIDPDNLLEALLKDWEARVMARAAEPEPSAPS